MTLETLQATKKILLIEVENWVKYKKEKFSNIDITQPMTETEKALNKRIADLYSEINSIVKQINNLKK